MTDNILSLVSTLSDGTLSQAQLSHHTKTLASVQGKTETKISILCFLRIFLKIIPLLNCNYKGKFLSSDNPEVGDMSSLHKCFFEYNNMQQLLNLLCF